jgi:hypothetical protein
MAPGDPKLKSSVVSLLSKRGSLLGKFPVAERDKNRDQKWKMGRLGGNPKL